MKSIKCTDDIMIVNFVLGNLEIIVIEIYIRSDMGDSDTHALYWNSLCQLYSLNCLLAGINLVQRHEPRRRFCPFFNR